MLQQVKRAVKKTLYSWRVGSIVNRVWNSKLTYLNHLALEELRNQCLRVEKEGIPGAFIEAGCALGGSAIVMASAKAPNRPMYLYDVFGLIPPPGENDDEDCHRRYDLIKSDEALGPEGTSYYGYQDNLVGVVSQNFSRLGYPVDKNKISLVKGLFQDTIHPDGPVAVAHIDGDWFDSVMTCLERIAPVLSIGGVMVIDDYHAWSGCRKAVDQFLASHPNASAFQKIHRQRLHILRTR
jgi:Macrocin-O-methyltransferase (TylF)